MDLSQEFLEHLNLRKPPGRVSLHLADHPGDTCSQGHPFGEGPDCVNCQPDRDLVEDAADFRTLVAHVIEKLNPTSGLGEAMDCLGSITAITDYVESLRCRCSIKAGSSPCPRCHVLGRHHDETVQR